MGIILLCKQQPLEVGGCWQFGWARVEGRRRLCEKKKAAGSQPLKKYEKLSVLIQEE